MATLTQVKANSGLITYSHKEDTVIVFAASHVTSYAILPDNNLLIKSPAGDNCLRFIDSADRDAGIAILDATMNLTLTEAFVTA